MQLPLSITQFQFETFFCSLDEQEETGHTFVFSNNISTNPPVCDNQTMKKSYSDLGIIIMPFTHKSNADVLKENDVSFFEEHDVSMLSNFLRFDGNFSLRRDTGFSSFRRWTATIDRRRSRSGRYGPLHIISSDSSSRYQLVCYCWE